MSVAELECYGLTDIGKVRPLNEDSFVVASMRKTVRLLHSSLPAPGPEGALAEAGAWLLAVADGVGGRPGGEVASSATVGGLLEYVTHAVGCYQSGDADREHEFLEQLEQSVHQAHERLRATTGGGERAPATTLTMAMVVGRRAYLIHVGDSRAYYLRRGRLRQLTQDQTIGEYMVDVGAWTPEQAARASAAHSLTSVVGGSEMNPSVGLIDLEPADVLLLCTDGLTRHVSDDDIRDILLSEPNAEAMTRRLVAAALAGGGGDNVSVVVARLPA